MKTWFVVGVGIALGALTSNAQMESSVLFEGKSYHQSINEKTMACLPQWDPLKKDCPLSPGGAVRAAVKALKAKAPGITFVKVDYVSLPAL